MTGRRAGYVLWLLLAGCLYFFENNTGTRAVLCCSLLLPLLPAVRRMLFTADDPRGEGEKPAVILRTAPEPEEEDGSEVRPYRAGDPVNRIHWKLSAKRREWLVRTPDRGTSPEEVRTERPAGAEGKKKPGLCRKATLLCLAALTAVALCILLIPPVRLGAEALCNRLFEASERVNAYAYERFTVPEEQTVVPAALLLSLGLALLLGIVFLTGSRLLGFAAVAGCAVFQVYFGLAFPGWANVLLAAGLALWVIRRPPEVRQVRTILSAVLITAILTALLFPGVDAATEDASERVRDLLSDAMLQITGTFRETEAEGPEARHTRTQSLITGEQEAQAEREYRLVTVEEEQISMPHWVNYLRIALLLLLTVLLVVLPFLPFLWLNARRKKALEARRAFGSEQVSEAVCAIFQQVIAWLEAMGFGAGNLPYREWTQHLPGDLPPGYEQRFSRCAALFEEAAYSSHALVEEQRQQMLDLLHETEQAMLDRADRKQRIRLKYGACLWTEKTE